MTKSELELKVKSLVEENESLVVKIDGFNTMLKSANDKITWLENGDKTKELEQEVDRLGKVIMKEQGEVESLRQRLANVSVPEEAKKTIAYARTLCGMTVRKVEMCQDAQKVQAALGGNFISELKKFAES